MQFFWHRNIQELIVLICLLVYTKPKNKTGCFRGAVAYCKVQSDDAKLYNVIYVVWFSGLRGYGNQRGGFDLLTLLVGTPPSWSETKSVPQTWTETTSTGGDHRVKQCFGPALLNRPYLSMNIDEPIEILSNNNKRYFLFCQTPRSVWRTTKTG